MTASGKRPRLLPGRSDCSFNPIKVRAPEDFDEAFQAAAAGRAEAMLAFDDPMLLSSGHGSSPSPPSTGCRRCTDSESSPTPAACMSYGPNLLDQYRRTATYVDKIFKGAKPADSACRASQQVRAGHQPEDRQGPRPDDPAVAPAAGGSGDRVMDRRAFIGHSLAASSPRRSPPRRSRRGRSTGSEFSGLATAETLDRRVPAGAPRARLRRGPERGHRVPDRTADRLPELAAELVRLQGGCHRGVGLVRGTGSQEGDDGHPDRRRP